MLRAVGWTRLVGAGDSRDTVCTPLPPAPEPPTVGAYNVSLFYPFSSLLSSLKKRQSVPWAMIFCGVLLMIPASCKRRA